jgi:hypothetical protein
MSSFGLILAISISSDTGIWQEPLSTSNWDEDHFRIWVDTENPFETLGGDAQALVPLHVSRVFS